MVLLLTAHPRGASATTIPTAPTATTAGDGSTNSLTAAKAAVLGLVEGLTEYLPVSSTGHLLIAERILNVGQREEERTATDSYTVVIQAGAILAVLGLYRYRIRTMIEGLVGRSPGGRSMVYALAAAFIPAAVIGKGLEGPIKDRLLRPWPVVAAWIVGGVIILLYAARGSQYLKAKTRLLEAVTVRQGVCIGVAQAFALWPGVSRSFAAILGGLVVGLSLPIAVEFSFLLGLLTLTAATAYEMLTNGSAIVDTFGVATPLLGAAVAAVAAFVSVKWMVSWLNSHSLAVFGWYRIGIGAVVAILLASGAI